MDDIEEKKQKLLEMLDIFLKEQANWNDEKASNYMLEMKKLSPDPSLSDYIFWPQNHGYDRELTPEEIVEKCFSYKPIIL